MPDAVECSRDIAVAPAVVYAAISDVTRMGEWSDECTGGEWLAGFDHAEPGATFCGHNRNGEHEWTTTATVIEAVPGRAFAFECSMYDFHYSTWGYRIEPIDTGARVTEWSVDLRPDEVLAFSSEISGVAARAERTSSAERTRASISTTLERLAAALEGTAARGGQS